jgi:hypothetical protein
MSTEQPLSITPELISGDGFVFNPQDKTITYQGKKFQLFSWGKSLETREEIEQAVATIKNVLLKQKNIQQEALANTSEESVQILCNERGVVSVWRGDRQVAAANSMAIEKVDKTYKANFQKTAVARVDHFEGLRDRCNSYDFSPDAIRKMCEQIRTEPNLRILGTPIDWGTERTVWDILCEPGNEQLFAAFGALEQAATADQASETFPGTREMPKKLKPEENPLLLYILEHAKKHPHICQGPQKSCFYQRSFQCREEGGISQFIPDRSDPSIVDDSRDKGRYTKHCPNLGSVVSKEGCHFVRSGKPDTPERLEELVRFSLNEQLNQPQEKRVGFKMNLNTHQYEFQLVINSALDFAKLKSGGELESLGQILKALDKWEDFDVDVEGRGVRLLRPIFTQQLFGATVRGSRLWSDEKPFWKLGEDKSAAYNFIANQQLLEKVIADRPLDEREQDDMINEFHALFPDGKLSKFMEISPGKREAYQKKLGFFLLWRMWSAKQKVSQAKTSLEKQQAQEDYELYYALFAINFRKAPPEGIVLENCVRDKEQFIHEFQVAPREEELIHVADIALYNYMVADHLHLAYAVGCRSGKDRTGYLTALDTAACMFKQEHGRTFMPPLDGEALSPQNEDLILFKLYYRKALRQLCLPITTESCGLCGLKGGIGSTWRIGGGTGEGAPFNPGESKYDILSEDIPFVRAQGVDIKEPDLEGLTYNDLRAHARFQYRGKPHEYTYGTTNPVIQKRLRDELSANRDAVLEASKRAKEILKSIGLPGKKIGANLELTCPVSDLHLGVSGVPRTAGKKVESRLQYLKSKLKDVCTEEQELQDELQKIKEGPAKLKGELQKLIDKQESKSQEILELQKKYLSPTEDNTNLLAQQEALQKLHQECAQIDQNIAQKQEEISGEPQRFSKQIQENSKEIAVHHYLHYVFENLIKLGERQEEIEACKNHYDVPCPPFAQGYVPPPARQGQEVIRVPLAGLATPIKEKIAVRPLLEKPIDISRICDVLEHLILTREAGQKVDPEYDASEATLVLRAYKALAKAQGNGNLNALRLRLRRIRSDPAFLRLTPAQEKLKSVMSQSRERPSPKQAEEIVALQAKLKAQVIFFRDHEAKKRAYKDLLAFEDGVARIKVEVSKVAAKNENTKMLFTAYEQFIGRDAVTRVQFAAWSLEENYESVFQFEELMEKAAAKGIHNFNDFDAYDNLFKRFQGAVMRLAGGGRELRGVLWDSDLLSKRVQQSKDRLQLIVAAKQHEIQNLQAMLAKKSADIVELEGKAGRYGKPLTPSQQKDKTENDSQNKVMDQYNNTTNVFFKKDLAPPEALLVNTGKTCSFLKESCELLENELSAVQVYDHVGDSAAKKQMLEKTKKIFQTIVSTINQIPNDAINQELTKQWAYVNGVTQQLQAIVAILKTKNGPAGVKGSPVLSTQKILELRRDLSDIDPAQPNAASAIQALEEFQEKASSMNATKFLAAVQHVLHLFQRIPNRTPPPSGLPRPAGKPKQTDEGLALYRASKIMRDTRLQELKDLLDAYLTQQTVR